MSGDKRYGNDSGCTSTRWSCAGPSVSKHEQLPESHRRILFCTPEYGDQSRLDCARQVIARFAERAFRRPVLPDEVERVLADLSTGPRPGRELRTRRPARADDGARLPAVLVPGRARRDARRSPADRVRAGQPALVFSLEQHARRRAVPRSTRRRRCGRISAGRWSECSPTPGPASSWRTSPASGCSSASWAAWPATRTSSPASTTTLRDAMRKETEQYFAHILRNNRSVLELLDSELHLCQRDAGAALWDRGRHGRRSFGRWLWRIGGGVAC